VPCVSRKSPSYSLRCGTTAAARGQFAHLPSGGRVVQHDEDAGTGQSAAVQLGAFFGAFGDGPAAHAEGAQEPGQHRVDALLGIRAEAAEVGEELPVAERGGDLVGHAHRQAGLSGPGLTADSRDPRRRGGLRAVRTVRAVRQKGAQSGRLALAAHEVGDVGGQLARRGDDLDVPGRDGRLARAVRRIEPGVPGEDVRHPPGAAGTAARPAPGTRPAPDGRRPRRTPRAGGGRVPPAAAAG
jgi:hypothetical protein